MAHGAALSGLASQLVSSLTGLSSDAQDFRSCRDGLLKTARSQQHGRTNQFEVEQSLEGLLEKFEILRRDGLADGLRINLARLRSKSSRWTPEILALLLHLSDRPLEKTDLTALEHLQEPTALSQLTWEDNIPDEPYNDGDIWRDIDYGAHGSSDEDSFESDNEGADDDVTATSVVSGSTGDAARAFVILPRHSVLDSIKGSQGALKAVRMNEDESERGCKTSLTELAIMRECIMMLRGLPSTIFVYDTSMRSFRPCMKVYLQPLSTTVTALLERLAKVGSSLQALRHWAARSQSDSLYQTLQSAVLDRLHQFGEDLTTLEVKWMPESKAAVISLAEMDVRVHDLVAISVELQAFTGLLRSEDPVYRYLDLLHERVCLAALTGEAALFAGLASIFFTCLCTYLRPVHKWMEVGVIDSEDKVTFITDTATSLDPEGAWHNRFGLKYMRDGQIDAPVFLQSFCRRILNAGKSVSLMKDLSGTPASTDGTTHYSDLTLGSVCGSAPPSLAPFSELLSSALTVWVENHHAVSSLAVRTRLTDDYGLWQTLDALDYLYFGRDGSLLQTFVDNISDKLARRSQTWNDRFVLTDLMRELYSIVAAVDTGKIVITTAKVRASSSSLQKLGSISITYKMHWAIGTIIQETTISVYRKLFSLKLQLFHLLNRLQTALIGTGLQQATNRSSRLESALRFRLTRFVTTLSTYMSDTVIQTQTKQLRPRLEAAGDIDEMTSIHSDYVRRLEVQALLTKNLQALRTAINQALELCSSFCDTHAQHHKLRGVADDSHKRHRRRRSALVVIDVQSDTDDEAQEDEQEQYHADVEGKTGTAARISGSHLQRVQGLSNEFDKLNAFIIHGLRGVSRAGSESCFELLAERLE